MPCKCVQLPALCPLLPNQRASHVSQVDNLDKQNTNLELGFPANVSHIITPESPLWNLSLLEMDTRMMEVLMFVDGGWFDSRLHCTCEYVCVDASCKNPKYWIGVARPNSNRVG